MQIEVGNTCGITFCTEGGNVWLCKLAFKMLKKSGSIIRRIKLSGEYTVNEGSIIERPEIGREG